jgi:ketosteroid isomerase-like protein
MRTARYLIDRRGEEAPMQPTEAELLDANEAFYRAFSGRDLAAMDALWARRTRVACIHPGWKALHGRTEVMASWRAIFENPATQPILCTDVSVSVLGDSALVVCSEALDGADLSATNVFTREDGAWKLVHHHAGPIARRAPSPKRPPSGVLN